MSKIIIANWHSQEENLGGQETFFNMLSKIFDAKIVSYLKAENVLKYNLFSNVFHIVYRGYVIDKYLKKYEDLFKPDLIIKNSAIGGFIKLKTPQIVVFQDPFHSIIKKSIENGNFFNIEHYSTCIELQRRSSKGTTTVAVSNFMKDDMKKCGIKCDKVIEEGVDIIKFRPIKGKDELRKMYNLPLDKKIGIAVTKFIPQKGWNILAELINKFPDIHWLVIFTSKVGSKPKLKNVSLIEQADHKLMPHFYNCADFYISTSLVESFNLSACEAASCGLPLIVFKTGWAWDWWDKRIGLRVDEWNYKDFEKAIEKMYNILNKKDGKVDNILYNPRKAIIEKGFTLDRMEKDWKQFVENLIKNK